MAVPAKAVTVAVPRVAKANPAKAAARVAAHLKAVVVHGVVRAAAVTAAASVEPLNSARSSNKKPGAGRVFCSLLTGHAPRVALNHFEAAAEAAEAAFLAFLAAFLAFLAWAEAASEATGAAAGASAAKAPTANMEAIRAAVSFFMD